jgi:hypothetical protein
MSDRCALFATLAVHDVQVTAGPVQVFRLAAGASQELKFRKFTPKSLCSKLNSCEDRDIRMLYE